MVLSWLWYKKDSNPESEEKKKHWVWEISGFSARIPACSGLDGKNFEI